MWYVLESSSSNPLLFKARLYFKKSVLQNTQYKDYSLFVQFACYYTSINIFKHQFPRNPLVDKWSFIYHFTAHKFEELLNICWTVLWISYWVGNFLNSTD